MRELGFKITKQSKGARKAYRRITKRYGLEKGREVFLDRADEHGEGTTLRQKVNSIYKTGGKFK